MKTQLQERIESISEHLDGEYPNDDHKERLKKVLITLLESEEIEEEKRERIGRSFDQLVCYIPDFKALDWNQGEELGDTLCALMAVDILWFKHIINEYADLYGLQNNLNYFILSQFWSDEARESVEFFFDCDEETSQFYYWFGNEKVYL